MQNLTQPTILLKPFAVEGDRNTLPNENSDETNPQLADLTNGFPPITSLSPDDGGLPPERKDFNGLGYLTTSYDFFYQAGGTFTYSPTIAAAIGGYPLGARLWYTNPIGVSMIVRSTIENNSNNFLTDSSVIGMAGEGKPWERENFLGYTAPYKLLQYSWFDYELDDMSWLNADTFSWQDGTVYSEVYSHLVSDIDDVTPTTELVGSYTITYYQAEDGHKIVMADQETTVQAIYDESGAAWYYILDTTDSRFKLPRINPAREELIQTIRAKGNGIALGITDGESFFGLLGGDTGHALKGRTACYGAEIGTNGGQSTATNNVAMGITSDSTKSGIISSMTDSTSVYKGKKYLYFYVGQFSQSATEQTAGLNTELFNGKLDIDLGNVSTVTKETIASWGMPDYTAGVSVSYTDLNSGYTAPYDGVLLCNFSLNGTVTINSLSFTAKLDYPNRQLREIHLNRGDVIKTTTLNVTYGGENMFFPLKGVNNA